MSSDKTNIQVSGENWTRLNAQKRPGESFDDVITQLLNDGGNEEHSD
jgi:predicted CopG family antitoxin